MIMSNLSTILGQRKIKISKVIKDTKISRPTLTALYYNHSKGINFDTLNTLCNYLQVSISDILSFYPIDIDTITISFKKISSEDIAIDEYREVELITNAHFQGSIDFYQKYIPAIKFSGCLHDPHFTSSTYDLTLILYTNTKIQEEPVQEYIIEAIENKIIEAFPADTGFDNDGNFTFDSISIHFNYENGMSDGVFIPHLKP